MHELYTSKLSIKIGKIKAIAVSTEFKGNTNSIYLDRNNFDK